MNRDLKAERNLACSWRLRLTLGRKVAEVIGQGQVCELSLPGRKEQNNPAARRQL